MVTAYQKIILISEVVGTAKLGVWLLHFVRAFGSVSRPAAAAAGGVVLVVFVHAPVGGKVSLESGVKRKREPDRGIRPTTAR